MTKGIAMTARTRREKMKSALAAALVAGAPVSAPSAAVVAQAPAFTPRTYQVPVWMDHDTPLLLVEFGRQLGKSQTLAEWAVNQIAEDFARGAQSSLVTVLSNSKANGQEFALKAAEAGRRWEGAQAEVDGPDGDTLERMTFDEMRFEIRIRLGSRVGRVLVLAANPRTARGFSGHLILDEFAFHQDASAIWEAAEPIVSSRPEFLCRIASTHNGKRTLFYQMARGGEYPVWSVSRSFAWRIGQGDAAAWEEFRGKFLALHPDNFLRWKRSGAELPAADKITIKSLKRRGAEITPEEAEAEATDRRAYRQNYENEPGDDAGALIDMKLITRAERAFDWRADEDAWAPDTLARLARLPADAEVYIGQDVGRTNDLSAVSVLYKSGAVRRMAALLTMRGMNLAHQRRQMETLITALGSRFRRAAIDFTGVGTGLCDELGEKFGSRILPVHFGSTVEVSADLRSACRRNATMRITERMGLDLLALFEDGHIEILQSAQLREDLRRPGRIVSASGMVSIAAERNKDDHSDRFWSLALAEHAILDGSAGAFTAEAAAEVLTGDGNLCGAPAHIDWSEGWQRRAARDLSEGPLTQKTGGGRGKDPHGPVRRAESVLSRLNSLLGQVRRTLSFHNSPHPALFGQFLTA